MEGTAILFPEFLDSQNLEAYSNFKIQEHGLVRALASYSRGVIHVPSSVSHSRVSFPWLIPIAHSRGAFPSLILVPHSCALHVGSPTGSLVSSKSTMIN